MFSLIANSTDSQVDANIVLTELDKGLRSTVIGEQCEAIVRFPLLFQRYPFPILINSASLKLSEVYRSGSNFLRILILQVVQESEKHLDKILNIDEFVRNLFAVSYSNDPLARSITLRTLGNIARIVPNNKNIHHFIRNSLDSNDELEVDAAIEASVRFAIQSEDFAENIYPKVISMIDGLSSSLKTKIKLLDVINNVHHNFTITEDARKKLISFLAKYPEKRFVCEDLHTLTSIAASSVTHISDQVKLLLEYYISDPRSVIKSSVLLDLRLLAHESGHLWERESITKFIDIIFANFPQSNFFSQIILDSNAKELKLLCEALGVLSELLGSPSIFIDESLFSSEHLSKIINFSTQIIHQSAGQNSTSAGSHSDRVQILLVSKCFAILTNVCLHANAEFIENADVLGETCCSYESFFFSKYTTDLSDRESRIALRAIFRHLVTLCRAKQSHQSQILQITEALRFILLNTKPNGSWFGMICETITSLAMIIWSNKSLTSNDILDLVKSRYGQSKKNRLSDEHGSTLLKILVIFFQLKVGSLISQKEAQNLLNILNGYNLWICYKVVREAMRFCHHDFAYQLLNRIKSSMEPIENTYFWMNSLARIAQAESFLYRNDFCDQDDFSKVSIEIKQFDEQLAAAVTTYIEGFTHLKASVSNSYPMRFQCEFIKLRMKYLQAHQHFRQCCKLLQSSPPPTSSLIGHNQTSAQDDFLKCGRIVTSMRKCAQEFRSIANAYSSLYQASFNADTNSLTNIQLLQHSCTIFAEVIENLFQSSHRISSLFVSSQSTSSLKANTRSNGSNVFDDNSGIDLKRFGIIEHKELESVCAMISELVRSEKLQCLANIAPSKQPTDVSGNYFLTAFTKQVQMLLLISTQILAVSLPLPRFYFQSIQAVQIKLELSPQPRPNSDYIVAHTQVNFVLNVEGVVINNANSGTETKPRNASNTKANFAASSISSIMVPCLPLSKRNMTCSLRSGHSNDRCKTIRNVNKILLVLNAVQVPSSSPNETSINSMPVLSMHAVVVPLNDYFQTQFLLTFKNVGFFYITVETSIIDENEAQWKTGPVQSIVAKVIEEFKSM